jgi:hypothetical protein
MRLEMGHASPERSDPNSMTTNSAVSGTPPLIFQTNRPRHSILLAKQCRPNTGDKNSFPLSSIQIVFGEAPEKS